MEAQLLTGFPLHYWRVSRMAGEGVVIDKLLQLLSLTPHSRDDIIFGSKAGQIDRQFLVHFDLEKITDFPYFGLILPTFGPNLISLLRSLVL